MKRLVGILSVFSVFFFFFQLQFLDASLNLNLLYLLVASRAVIGRFIGPYSTLGPAKI